MRSSATIFALRLLVLVVLAGISFGAMGHEDREVRGERRELREERRERDASRAQERAARDARDVARAAERSAERAAKDAADLAEKSASSSDGSNSGSSDDSDDRIDNSGPGSSDDDDDMAEGRSGPSLARIDVERDPLGRERRGDEVLMIGRTESIVAARAAGYTIISERPMTSMGETLARIRVRSGTSVEQTIAELQSLAPDASVAPHHLFRPSQGATGTPDAQQAPVTAATPRAVTIGVIDTGVATSSALLARAVTRTQAFTESGYRPRPHGTLVASIAAAGGAGVAVADVFGIDTENRLIASAAAIAAAIDWLVTAHVPVINISIEGPDNIVLARVIRRALASNTAIVAAAGNGGPVASAPFPAAYPGVIAVTAVDASGEVYRRANRGDYITFAARGVRISNADVGGAKVVSGTSFASPIVSAAIAQHLTRDATSVAQALDLLRREALDLGPPGRDSIFGWGEIKPLEPLAQAR